MMDPLVSVIVPVYNSARYLKKCVGSILKQSYKQIEVLLVNDGSKDNSGRICDAFAEADKRVRVLHLPNGGVGAARNAGIDIAKGSFICFVDADDYLPSDSVEHLMRQLQKTEADLVCGGWEKILAIGSLSNEDRNYICTATTQKDVMFAYSEIEEVNGPVAKVYKTQIIRDQNIRFPVEVKIGEDAIFNYRYLQKASKVVFSPKTVYCYNKLNASSATHTFYAGMLQWCLECALEQSRVVSDNSKDLLAQRVFYKRFSTAVMYAYYYLGGGSECISSIQAAYEIFRDHLDPEVICGDEKCAGYFPVEAYEYCQKGDFGKAVEVLCRHIPGKKTGMKQRAKETVYRLLGKVREYLIFRVMKGL